MPKSRGQRPAGGGDQTRTPGGHTHLHIHCDGNPVPRHLLRQLAHLFCERLGPSQRDECSRIADERLSRRSVYAPDSSVLSAPSGRTCCGYHPDVHSISDGELGWSECPFTASYAGSPRVNMADGQTKSVSSPKSAQGLALASQLSGNNLKISPTENNIIPPGILDTDSSFK